MDYFLTLTELTFPAGSEQGDTVCTDIDIIDDEAVENSEYFYVELSTNDSNVQLLILRYYQSRGFCYRIYDNDGKIDYCSCVHVQETVAGHIHKNIIKC